MMMFLWLPFLFLIPFAILWLARSGGAMGCCSAPHAVNPQSPGGADAVEIARQRLARGEITVAEFEEIRRLIS
ncbi:MAG: SHOCT domain-containing protein [Coriobacteriales bacterium]|nr:SHOCT domain-containing protein [Coriobacteriales bacterium]